MGKLSGKLAVEYFPRFAATERFDHKIIINNLFTIVNWKKILGIAQGPKDVPERRNIYSLP